MPNWNHLKILRRHRTIMTIIIIALLGFIFYSSKYNSSNSFSNQKRVVAKSGLKVRTEPNSHSDVLVIIPYNQNLKIIEKEGNTDIVNGQEGKWYKVEYKNTVGYAWSKFIEE